MILVAAFFLATNADSQTWKKVVCGGEFSAALSSDGTLWSWGFNYNGQLGQGDTSRQFSPVQIGTDHDWADIEAGGFHCVALKLTVLYGLGGLMEMAKWEIVPGLINMLLCK